ncbi:tetratricopeptide repeat protein [Herbaspirillum lusitanum]|jgi:predicted TPR repeat methyltransferase|uniref:Tetratricopeptide repeat protein n=1 Tax=Herbaspirillum lusitanum TaxID=213312 RepID=A0ABW9A1F6_9BURK
MQSTTENQAVLQATLQRGIDAHLAGQLEQAAQIYRDVLDRDPIEPVALHYLGIYLHQIGEHDEALEKLVLSTALESDNAGWHNDLGNVLFALQRFEDAAQSYADALAITPDDHSIWNNLGAVHLQLAEKQEAIAAFKRAVELAPEFVPALTHLGSIYQADGNKMEASHYQCRAFVVPPLEGKSKEMLGISFYFLGRLAEAAEIYRAWLQEEPGHPIAAHLMAACSQSDVPERASDSYIEFHFDRYAETFDANLLNSLAYRGPQLIGLGLELVGAPAHQFEVIDIGCGTGLCGPFLAPFSKHIVGVDLAGKMLGKARSGGHYTQLEKAEIGDYLSRNPGSCDLVTAADTMIYFGDLGPVFGKVAKSLRDDGYFIFTIEVVTATDQAPGGYCLHASGRYRHGLDYVTHHLRSNGLQLLHHSEQILREEIRQSVAGLLFVARRLPS